MIKYNNYASASSTRYVYLTPLLLNVFKALIILWVLFDTAWVFAAKNSNKAPIHVIVAPVRIVEMSDRIEALGSARAIEAVNITSNVSEKVKEIHFEDGQFVKTNDILVVLDESEEQANLEQFVALHGQRQLALKRLLRLEKSQLVSKDELDLARLEVQQAKANISAIKARINDRVIRAPFSGVVGLRQISLGALVEAGTLITTLDDTRFIKLDFSVPAIFLTELKTGLKTQARSAALGAQVYLGEVKSVDSRIDPVTRSVQVRALVPNTDSRIIPGMLMQVDLLRNTRQTLQIPEAALLPLAKKHFVMVRIKKNGIDSVEKRAVKIGARVPGYVEIISGVYETEQVVTHGNNKLKPGAAINVLAVDDGSVDIENILKGKATSGIKSGKKQ